MYKSSFSQNTDGSTVAVVNFKFENGVTYKVVVSTSANGIATFSPSADQVAQQMSARPQLASQTNTQMAQMVDPSSNQPMRALGCTIAWLALAWRIISHDAVGAALAAANVACVCFGWCLF
jgi:hypothetical protein